MGLSGSHSPPNPLSFPRKMMPATILIPIPKSLLFSFAVHYCFFRLSFSRHWARSSLFVRAQFGTVDASRRNFQKATTGTASEDLPRARKPQTGKSTITSFSSVMWNLWGITGCIFSIVNICTLSLSLQRNRVSKYNQNTSKWPDDQPAQNRIKNRIKTRLKIKMWIKNQIKIIS